MKILQCNLENFSSYESLDFDFSDCGLTLIHGHTGSGKSTLCDAIPWVLFGRTAKGGAVDEVLTWPGNTVTSGRVTVAGTQGNITIRRTRGKAKDNDLCYFLSETGQAVRGKDLTDTQKMINTLLGVDYDLYMAAAYFHEFSQTAQFFTTTPKNRRSICEQVVDLSLPKVLQEKSSSKLKVLTKELAAVQNKIKSTENEILVSTRLLGNLTESLNNWTTKKDTRLTDLQKKSTQFEAINYGQLQVLKASVFNHTKSVKNDSFYKDMKDAILADMPPETEPCRECGAPKNNALRQELKDKLQSLELSRLKNKAKANEVKALSEQIKALLASTNPYEQQIIDLQQETGPDASNVDALSKAVVKSAEILDYNNNLLISLSTQVGDLEALSDVLASFRSSLISNTIDSLESQTNDLLDKHYDSELKVELAIEDADKLDVIISKDGNNCSYTQLSKGQRQLLKLCFSIAVMNCVSERHNISPAQIFLDEALDGLDESFKIKAVQMLESLAQKYPSVFLVEHSSEVKAMVDNKFKVELVNGKSKIYSET
jgi:DNA repair exonuclease SbcCD ATPase subunit